MATDNILRSYGDVSVKEDVLELIEILTATEDSIMSTVGKTTAIQTVHNTLVDTLDTAASLAVGEAGDYTATALTTPTRLTNIVQIVAKNYKVSRTQQEIDHYHGENELARQTKKAMQDWANAAEYDFVRGSLVSGVSGIAPRMNGVIMQISKATNTTAHTSGTVFSASILKGLMKANWDNSNGDVATDVYMGSFLSDVTDDFTTKSTVVSNGLPVKSVINVTDVFETGLGKVRKHTHRYVQITADATGRVLGIRPEKVKCAYLRKPYVDTGLARSGDYDVRAIVGKLTAEVRNQDSNWFATGFLK